MSIVGRVIVRRTNGSRAETSVSVAETSVIKHFTSSEPLTPRVHTVDGSVLLILGR